MDYSITIEGLCKEITKCLQHEFDEFKELSALKVVQLWHKTTNNVIPFLGVVKDYISEEDEIICEVRSLDIWLNVYINFKSTLHCAQSYVQMKVENNLPVEVFKGICQKLALVVWNKFCSEMALTSNPDSNFGTPSESSKVCYRKDRHLYDKRILTPSTEKKNYDRRKSLTDILLGKTNIKSIPNKKVLLEDQQLKGIIEEDSEHGGDFGYAQRLAMQSSKYPCYTLF